MPEKKSLLELCFWIWVVVYSILSIASMATKGDYDSRLTLLAEEGAILRRKLEAATRQIPKENTPTKQLDDKNKPILKIVINVRCKLLELWNQDEVTPKSEAKPKNTDANKAEAVKK